MVAAWTRHQPASGIEDRIAQFTDLVATAISNAQARADLAASRARIVAASDQTRRRIERDLHDGAQQRLVSLGLALRAAQRAVPPGQAELGQELARVADGLTEVLEELREMSRGIHPAILSLGGLGPALKALARRSAVPVQLDVQVRARLPERAEVAAYFVVSEALANVAKHAQASVVRVRVEVRDGVLHVSIQRRRRRRSRSVPRLRAHRPDRPRRGVGRHDQHLEPRRTGNPDHGRASRRRRLARRGSAPARLSIS